MLARTYPNAALPAQGLWAARLTQAVIPFADPVVVSPVPWVPPGTGVVEWQRLRSVPREAMIGGLKVLYPRVPGGLTAFTHRFDAHLAAPSLLRLIRQLHSSQPFDLLHAHFIFPDGVIASRIGRALGIPVITTEHANWRPWLDEQPSVRRQVLKALAGIRIVTAVSEATRRTVLDVAGDSQCVELLPNVLDESSFPEPSGEKRVPGRVLFVGIPRKVKGLDVLVRALPQLIARRPAAHLRVIGSPETPSNRRDFQLVKRLAESLGVCDRITFLDRVPPAEVSAEMRRASAVAVPSHRESFSAVAIEALASGTPVVATRCGGPEELLDDEVGRLVPVDDPSALADALADVLGETVRFDPAVLRARVLPRFGSAATTERLRALYRRAVAPADTAGNEPSRRAVL